MGDMEGGLRTCLGRNLMRSTSPDDAARDEIVHELYRDSEAYVPQGAPARSVSVPLAFSKISSLTMPASMNRSKSFMFSTCHDTSTKALSEHSKSGSMMRSHASRARRSPAMWKLRSSNFPHLPPSSAACLFEGTLDLGISALPGAACGRSAR